VKIFGFRTWNDRLSLILMVGIPGLWVFSAVVAPLAEAVLGATISVWTLVAMFYFRKAPPEDTTKPTGGGTP